MTRFNLELELPDKLAKQAQEAGLLTSEALEQLLRDAMQRRAGECFLSVADRVNEAEIPEMSSEEIEREIEAYRDERRSATGT